MRPLASDVTVCDWRTRGRVNVIGALIDKCLPKWLRKYNETRPHSGKYYYGKTPMQTFRGVKELTQLKMIDTVQELSDSAPQQAPAVR